MIGLEWLYGDVLYTVVVGWDNQPQANSILSNPNPKYVCLEIEF